MNHLATRFLQYPFEGGLGMLEPDPKSEKDLKLELLGADSYSPKEQRKVIPTYSVKDQTGRNTCTFESVIVQKEVDEGVPLSTRSIVVYAASQGFITGNGFSSLKNSQKCIQDYGALEQHVVPDYHGSFSVYLSQPVTSAPFREEAKKHRSDTYWRAESIAEIYKMIDSGKVVQAALRWYSGYNQGGGFNYPYILPYRGGYKVGNHAVAIIGYDRSLRGRDVFIFQNSFGSNWGENGCFYMNVEDFAGELDIFGSFVQQDIPRSIGEFIRDYTGKPVMSLSSPKVYVIENGEKRWFETEQAMLSRGYNIRETKVVEQETLNLIPEGEVIHS